MKTPKVLFLTAALILSGVAYGNCVDNKGILREGTISPAPGECAGQMVYVNYEDTMSACPPGSHLHPQSVNLQSKARQEALRAY